MSKKKKPHYITIHKATGGYAVEAWMGGGEIDRIVYTSTEDLCKGIQELFDGNN